MTSFSDQKARRGARGALPHETESPTSEEGGDAMAALWERMMRRWLDAQALACLDEHLREDIGLLRPLPPVPPLVAAWLH